MLNPKSFNQDNRAAREQEQRAIGRQYSIAPALGQNLLPMARPARFDANAQPLPRAAQRGIITAFSNTCHRWQLYEAQHYVLLGFGDDTFLGEQILYGQLKAPQDVRDRAAYVVSISVGLGSIFNEDAEAERHWLNSPLVALQNKTPMGFMLEGKMINLMRVLAEVEKARGF